MTTTNIIEGLQILQKYRKEKDGYNISAEHDTIYADATDKPVIKQDLKRLIKLGWFQEDVAQDEDGNFTPENYDPGASWACYV